MVLCIIFYAEYLSLLGLNTISVLVFCVCVSVWVHLVVSYCTVDILFPVLKSAWKYSVVFQRWEDIDGHHLLTLPNQKKKKKKLFPSQAIYLSKQSSEYVLKYREIKTRPLIQRLR